MICAWDCYWPIELPCVIRALAEKSRPFPFTFVCWRQLHGVEKSGHSPGAGVSDVFLLHSNYAGELVVI